MVYASCARAPTRRVVGFSFIVDKVRFYLVVRSQLTLQPSQLSRKKIMASYDEEEEAILRTVLAQSAAEEAEEQAQIRMGLAASAAEFAEEDAELRAALALSAAEASEDDFRVRQGIANSLNDSLYTDSLNDRRETPEQHAQPCTVGEFMELMKELTSPHLLSFAQFLGVGEGLTSHRRPVPDYRLLLKTVADAVSVELPGVARSLKKVRDVCNCHAHDDVLTYHVIHHAVCRLIEVLYVAESQVEGFPLEAVDAVSEALMSHVARLVVAENHIGSEDSFTEMGPTASSTTSSLTSSLSAPTEACSREGCIIFFVSGFCLSGSECPNCHDPSCGHY